MSSEVKRKLTTILAADAEGYSREMEADELATLSALRAARQVFAALIERHNGRIANTAGDGLIADFPSVVEAVQCAINVQRELEDRDRGRGHALRFRIGIHLGDVIVEGDDLLGEGVNLAARLQAMAEPGGVLLSQQVYDHVKGKLSVGFEYLGDKRPRNFATDVAVYRVSHGVGADWRSAAQAGRITADAGTVPDPRYLRARLIRRARQSVVIVGALWVIDVATGPPLWVQWPGAILLILLAYGSAPLFTRGWFGLRMARMAVFIGVLVVVNLLTWDGSAWSLWPVAGFATLALVQSRRAR